MKTAEAKKPGNGLKKGKGQAGQDSSDKIRANTAIEPQSDNDQLAPELENSPNKGQGPAGENL